MPYSNLDPRTQLEQRVALDLETALGLRGGTVTHHGTPTWHAPANAPCDISARYGSVAQRRSLLIEVAQRPDASEFQSIVSHLDAWVEANPEPSNLLYSGRSTSARMARLVRNENERRESVGRRGRIVFLKLDDLESFIYHWIGLPPDEVPTEKIDLIFDRWRDCKDDLTAAAVIRDSLFPAW